VTLSCSSNMAIATIFDTCTAVGAVLNYVWSPGCEDEHFSRGSACVVSLTFAMMSVAAITACDNLNECITGAQSEDGHIVESCLDE
jgi:hypothetical protein